MPKRAEELFKKNINYYILAEVFSDEESIKSKYKHSRVEFKIFKGKLLDTSCNTFIIKTDEGFVEMFRYEDTRYLKVLENIKGDSENNV